MLHICLAGRFQLGSCLDRFQTELGRKFPRGWFNERIAYKLLQSMVLITKMLARRKREYAQKIRRIRKSSLLALLRLVDLETEDELIAEAKWAGEKLSALLLVYADNLEADRDELFAKFHAVCTRREFEKVWTNLGFVEQLNQIYQSALTEDWQLGGHPYLRPTIAENQGLRIYDEIINQNDWNRKYRLFQEIQAQNNACDDWVHMNAPPRFTKPESKFVVLRKRTPRFGIEKRILAPNKATIVFERDIEEEQSEEECTRHKASMQLLYEEAFLYAERLKQRELRQKRKLDQQQESNSRRQSEEVNQINEEKRSLNAFRNEQQFQSNQ